jgi:hypothetical protein
MLEWPKSSWTYFGCLPAMRGIVAQVWRRSWKRMRGSSALFRRGLKWRPRRLVALVVVPVRVGKMIKEIRRSCHNRLPAGVFMSKSRETLEETWPAKPGSRRPN